MSDLQEIEYAKNIAAFHQLVSLCIDMEKVYRPESINLQPAALYQQLSACRQALEEAKECKMKLAKSLRLREVSFQPIAQLTNNVLKELSEAKASPQTIREALGQVKEIQESSSRKAPKKVNSNKIIGTAKSEYYSQSVNHSKVIEQFDQLIQTVTIEPNYLPNKLDLKIIMLKLVLQELQSKHNAVIFAELSLNNARQHCSQLIDGHNGLIQTANDVIDYIAEITRSTGPIYRKVSAIRFIRPVKKRTILASHK